MNPRERLMCTLRGKKADRVPLDLHGFQLTSRKQLATIDDPFRKQISERVVDQTHFAVGIGSHLNRYMVTPPQRIQSVSEELDGGFRLTRGIIDTPKGNLTFTTKWDPVSATAWTLKYPVECEADIEKIAAIPWERPPGLKPPELAGLPAEFHERGTLRTGVSSPFVCVAGTMAYETFLGMCATHLDLIRDLTEICLQRVLDCLSVLLSKPGIEYVWMGGSEWVTPPMGSPAIYDRLVQEQERAIIDYVHRNSDAIVHIHCHGHVRHAIQRCIEREADYTEPVEPPPDGDITMAEAKQLAAGRITLGGNIEARILCNEPEEAVEQAVHAAFEGGKERFVLSTTAGPSPTITEREFRNTMRLIDSWEELSPIR